mmetsp:Transcript_19712/g.55027  ORF Transcript_19712/g.55027 Transcript_19712/m.55027 type:complete len:304 (-) Transcript_19712:621-1532(-)
MVDGGQCGVGEQVHDANSLHVNEVCQACEHSAGFWHVAAIAHSPLLRNHTQQCGVHMLSAAHAQNLVAPIRHQSQLARIVNHTDGFIVKDELLSAMSSTPWNLTEVAALQISHQECLCCARNEEPVLVDVDALNLVLVHAPEHNALAALELLYNHAALADVSKFEPSLVALALEACIVYVHAAGHVADTQLGAVWFPRQGCDGVQVVYMLHGCLFPRVSDRVVDVHIEAVVRAKHHRIAAWVEGTCSELTHAIVPTIVKCLERAPTSVIEHHLIVIASRRNALTPSQRIGYRRVHHHLGAAHT